MTVKSLVLEDNHEFFSISVFGSRPPVIPTPQQSNLLRLLSCSDDPNHYHGDSHTSCSQITLNSQCLIYYNTDGD